LRDLFNDIIVRFGLVLWAWRSCANAKEVDKSEAIYGAIRSRCCGNHGVSCLCFASTLGAELKLPQGPYNYSIVDRDTKDLLEEFGKNIYVPVDVSGRIAGRPRGPLPSGTAEEFPDGVCESEAIVWYFDGTKLYFSAASEIDSLMIVFGSLPLQELSDRLHRLGIAESRYPLNTTRRAEIIMVKGPPRYVALVRQAYQAMSRLPAQPDFRGSLPNPVGDFPPYYR
jgi:type II secretory pathway component GspD/PulD (secretin)